MFQATTVGEEAGGEVDTGEVIEVMLVTALTADRPVAGVLCCTIPSSAL